MDREKVIQALEQCIGTMDCDGCPYLDNGCRSQAEKDAVELLREQESNLLIQHEEGFHDGYNQAMSEIRDKNILPEIKTEWTDMDRAIGAVFKIRKMLEDIDEVTNPIAEYFYELAGEDKYVDVMRRAKE